MDEPYADLFIRELPHYDGLAATYGALTIEVDDETDESKHLTLAEAVTGFGSTIFAKLEGGNSFAGDQTFQSGADFIFGTGTGSMIGTGATQKLAFWGAAPVVRPAAVADATGGATVDAECRTAVNAVIARLRTLGLITT